MKFKLQNIQTALFIESLDNMKDISNFPSQEKLNSFLDGQPFFTNVPADAPKDIPRLVLQSSDGSYKCNISFSRVDLFQEKKIPEKELSLEEHKEKTIDIINFLDSKGKSINRIGFVGIFLSVNEEFSEEDGVKSANYIKNSFIQGGLLNDPKELNIGYNKRKNKDDLEFNHVINFWGNDKKELRLQIDINNVPTSAKNKDELVSILDYSAKKIEEIKESFPNINI